MEVDPGVLLVLAYILLWLLLLLFGAVIGVEAGELERDQAMAMEDVHRGELLAVMEDGRLIPTPQLSQQVAMQVSGIVNRVSVSQHFVNSTEEWIEAVYVFPLPEDSAVDHMRLIVGERMIEGEIHEKSHAQKLYKQAKREGRKSTLLQQNRPNLFTTRVANIGPGEEVVVEIEYQQLVSYLDGVFSFRFPMVVAPRYHPEPGVTERVAPGSSGWAEKELPDATEISAPYYTDGRRSNPIELTIDLAAGVPLARLDSLYHQTVTREIAEGQYQLTLAEEVFADRDFVLEWQTENAERVQAALFSESLGSDQYLLLMLLPPQEQKERKIPREVIFILDVSGSMAGASIVQAKEGIKIALQSLDELDTFNLITFNNAAHTLFARPKPATARNLQEAGGYIDSLKAEGGTEMLPALSLALDGLEVHKRLRQVIFMTDGAVSNEADLFRLIYENLGDSRLFTVGIGSAPNGYFMTRASRLGRGTYVYIGKKSEVKAKIEQLVTKLESPVVSNLQLNLNGHSREVELYPSPIPDLYQGEPLFVVLKSGWYNSALRLTGSGASKPWQMIVDTSTFGNRQGIAALWARKKILHLMESLALGGLEEDIREKITSTAVKHHLVSPYTSLVGVDKEVSRSPNTPHNRAQVPLNMPVGWQASAVFGGGVQTATPALLRLVSGILMLFLALLIFLRYRRYGCAG